MKQYNCIARVVELNDEWCIFKTKDYLELTQYSSGIKIFGNTVSIKAQLPSMSSVFSENLLYYCAKHGRDSLKYQELNFIFHLESYGFYDKKLKKYVRGNKVILDLVDRLPLMEHE